MPQNAFPALNSLESAIPFGSGLATGALIVLSLAPMLRAAWSRGGDTWLLPLVATGGCLASLGLAIAGLATTPGELARTMLLAVFGTATLLILLSLVQAMREEPLEIQSGWGGLGGGLGGFTISRPLVLLLLVAGFGTATLMVAVPPATPPKPDAAKEKAAASSTTLTLRSETTRPANGD